jgi:RNA ligase
MTHIDEIVDPVKLGVEILKGNLTLRNHPEFPDLVIANYTDQVAFKRDWNDVTRLCRGLIWSEVTGEVLARPFPKFFNFDEPESPRILDEQVVWHWADKADGSLGIMYRAPDHSYRIATRGSFVSEQADLGSRLLSVMPMEYFGAYVGMIENGYTPLFEICGPDNRIVLRYEENFLQPLGYIHVATGQFVPPVGAESRTMRDLLGDLSRSNAEGWVVWLSNTKAVKIKQADYIELHRMVSNLSEKEVWRQLRAGTYAKYVEQLPDELYKLAEGWADDLRREFTRIYVMAKAQHSLVSNLQSVGGEAYSRKDQAFHLKQNVKPELHGLVFSLLDGKDISDSIWRTLEPKTTNERITA